MKKLLEGHRAFLNQADADSLNKLAAGQKPEALMITCSDSRIDPAAMLGAEPGQLFVIRNAGNIVPPQGEVSGEAATIEYAMKALAIPHIIVCGHSHCGAMQGLLQGDDLSETLPEVGLWLEFADGALLQIPDEADDRLQACVQENVHHQIENLLTHDSVRERYEAGEVKIHAWVYKIETGEILTHGKEGFVPLNKTN